jgi:hypothetical protein
MDISGMTYGKSGTTIASISSSSVDSNPVNSGISKSRISKSGAAGGLGIFGAFGTLSGTSMVVVVGVRVYSPTAIKELMKVVAVDHAFDA